MSERPVPIRFVGVTKRFGEQTVLDNLDFEVPRGKITFVLGRSGTGKSVMLKHMIGLLAPDSGEVWVEGADITRLGEREMNAVRRRFGMLFQDAALFDSLDVYENIAFPLREHTRLDERKIRETVARKLELVGLPGVERKLPSQLSGGMRKRVGLARAIALDPDIILYDEPTTGLDPLMVEQIDSLIVRTQKAQNVTSVVISHDIPTALRIADRIAVLEGGRIVAEGSPADLQMSEHPFVKDFIRAAS